MATATDRYGKLSIVVHWSTLAILVAVYACIELRELYPRGSEIRAMLKTWHYMLGLTVFFLVWLRIAARLLGKTPPIVPAVPQWQITIAHVVELALYALMIALPLLGWVMLSAEGEVIPFFGLELPALVGTDRMLAERVEDVHETLATAGYFLIGLHAIAALFHHYVQRDNTLRRMTLLR
jgi:cytochrome b561